MTLCKRFKASQSTNHEVARSEQLETPNLKSNTTKTLKQKQLQNRSTYSTWAPKKQLEVLTMLSPPRGTNQKKLRYLRVARTVSDHYVVNEYSDTLYTLQSFVINKSRSCKKRTVGNTELESDATKTLKQEATPEQIYIFNLDTEEAIGSVN